MTKDEFMAAYARARSHVRAEAAKWFRDRALVALPCECGDETCLGWAAVSRCGLCGVHHHQPPQGGCDPDEGKNYTRCEACHRTNGTLRIYNYSANWSRFALKFVHEGEHAYDEIEFRADSPTDRAKLTELHDVLGKFLRGEYKRP